MKAVSLCLLVCGVVAASAQKSGSSIEQGRLMRRLFGEKVKVADYDSSQAYTNGDKPVSAAVQLDCDFGGACCWRAEQFAVADALSWRVAKGEVPRANFERNFIITDPKNAYPPKGEFLAALASSKRDAGEKALYRSCPLCADGVVNVTLRHWNTVRVALHVCWQDVTLAGGADALLTGDYEKNCQRISSEYSPGLTRLQLRPPTDRIVELVFTAGNFVAGDGGAAIIDDVDIGTKACSLEKLSGIRRWAAEQKAQAAVVELQKKREQKLAEEQAALLAAREAPELPTKEDEDFLEDIVERGGEFPAEDLYEDLTGGAETTSAPPPTEPPTTTKVAATPFPGEKCATRAACSFESATMCHYRNVFADEPLFKLHSGRVRSRLSGFSKAAEGITYLVVKMKGGQTSAIEVDLAGELAQQAFDVVFKSYEASNQQSLKGCCEVDGQTDCLFSTDIGIQIEDRQWRHSAFTCPAGTSKIRFECENTGRFLGICALDDIRVYDTSAEQKQIC